MNKSFTRYNGGLGFTLIELLVVIAIIAILAVVVVLTLNPAQLLQQSRDANRLSDMQTVNSALGLYDTDLGSSPSFSLGSSSIAYVSIPDPTATTTAGTNCATLNLPTLAGYTYHCAASSTYRNTDGTGWIPVNFKAITAGTPLGSLPIDPTNTTSSCEYYVYVASGTQYEVVGNPESQKDASTTFAQGNAMSLLTSNGCSAGGGAAITYTTSTVATGGVKPDAFAFDPTSDSMWVATAAGVTKIDEAHAYATSAYTVESGGMVAFDSTSDSIWVAGGLDGNAVTKIDEAHSYVTSTYTAGNEPFGIAFDSTSDSIWVANQGDNTVTKIDEAHSYATSTYTVGGGPAGIVFDPTTDSIWVTNEIDGTVTRIDEAHSYATSTYVVGSEPGDITFDSTTDSIWTANIYDGTVTRIDEAHSYATSTYAVGSYPVGITFDSHTNTIWVANLFSSSLTAINDSNFTTSTYTLGITPFAIAFDSHTNTIWVPDFSTGIITIFTPSR